MNNQNTNVEDRLTLIEKSIQELKERHNSLVMMIVEGKLGSASPNEKPKPSPSLAPQVFPNTPNEKPALFKPFPSQPKTETIEDSPILFPIISVICFVLAAVFLVKMAYDAEWLTPVRQLGLIFIFGIILVGLGCFYEKIENEYRGFLSSAGSIVLFIAAVSSSTHFGLLSTEASILICLLVSLMSIYLADFHESQLLSVITVIGTYSAPMMLGRNEDLTLLSTYFVFCAITFTQIALFFSSRTISLIASYLGIGIYSLLNLGLADSNKLMVVVGVLIAQFMVFSFGVYDYSTNKKKPMTYSMAIFHSPVLILFYGCTYFFLNRIDPKLAPWISLAFAGFVFALYQGAKERIGNLESGQVVYGFIFFILFHAGYMQLMPDQFKVFLIPLVLIGLLFWNGGNASSQELKIANVFVGLILIIELFGMFGHLLNKPFDLSIFIAATLTIFAGYAPFRLALSLQFLLGATQDTQDTQDATTTTTTTK